MVHLVLGAGGARCISYVGALSVLAERGVSFASVSACSAGTLIGALLCAGLSPGELEEQVLSQNLSRIAGEKVLPGPLCLLGLLKWPFAMYKKPGFKGLFRQILNGRDPQFNELQIPLALAGVDIASDRILVYSADQHPEMHVSEAIQIATAVPCAYPPHRDRSGRRIVVDAAVMTQCPIWIAAGHDDYLPIVALSAEPPNQGDKTPRFFLNYLIDAFVSGIYSRDYYYTQQLPRVRSIEIPCGGVRHDQFNLSERQKMDLIAAGRKAASSLLDELGDDLWSVNPEPLILDRGPKSPEDLAEQQAAELITGFQRKLPKLMREQVFISYSHEDADWLERLKNQLRNHTSSRNMVVWDDQSIKPGDVWKNKIRTALASTKVAVLLVSPNFLGSDFISEEELSYLVSVARNEEVRLIWFNIADCDYRNTALNDIQSAWDLDKPLSDLTEEEQNVALEEICRQIAEAVNEGET